MAALSYISSPEVTPIPIIPPVGGIALSTIALLQIPDSYGWIPIPNTFTSAFAHPVGQTAMIISKLANLVYFGPNFSLLATTSSHVNYIMLFLSIWLNPPPL